MTRAEAAAQGQRRYEGNPCKLGHEGERYTSNGLCVECQAVRSKLGWQARKARQALEPRKPRPPRAPRTPKAPTAEHLCYLQSMADGIRTPADDRNMRRRVVWRLGAKSIVHAVATALRRGLID